MSNFEMEELKKSALARDIQEVIRVGKLAAPGIRMLPDFGVKFHFWGLGGDMKLGGSTLGEVAGRYATEVAMAVGDHYAHEAGSAAKVGGGGEGEQDWEHQSNVAAREITQINKQLRAAQIREAVGEPGAAEPQGADGEPEGNRGLPERRGTREQGQDDQQGVVHLNEARGEGAVLTVLPVRV